MKTPTDTFIDIGHTQVAYECVGDGSDVLLIHGWPLHRETWREVIPGLEGYRCHLIDLPGTGRSRATDDTPLTLTAQAESIGKVIDEVGLNQLSLVGNDSGGMLARMVAAERPDQISCLVLTGTEIPDHHPWQLALYTMLANLPGGDSVLKMTLSNKILANSPLALGGCFYDTGSITPRFATILTDMLSDGDVTKSQMTLVRNFDNAVVDALSEVHNRLEMPTLFVWGEDDPFFPVEKARAMVAQFAGPTRFEVVPKAKLLVHEEHPERFAELVRNFLAEHVGP